MDPELSVIIPAYNSEKTLAETLQGLAAQQCNSPWEVIVVDNGSVDRTTAVAKNFQDAFEQFTLICVEENCGPAFGRNFGAARARAEKLVFLDADDVPAEGWLAAMDAALEQHRFVASRHEGERLNCSKGLLFREVPQSQGLQQYDYPSFLPHSGGCGLGVHKTVHDRVGGFDETWRVLEDTDYCWRIQLTGVPLHFEGRAIVHIRLRRDHRQSLFQAFRWGRNNVRLYKRFRSHMPPIPWKKGLRWWRYFLAPRYMISQLKNYNTRPRWLWQVSWRLGRIVGSVRYATWAL